MSYVRQSQGAYVSPIKSTKSPQSMTPTSTIMKKQHPSDMSPNFSRQTERSVSPINPSRRESVNDKVADLMRMNERLREEADYWHRQALERDKSVSDNELKKLVQICEKQAMELREYKYRAEQGGSRLPTLSTVQRTNYDHQFQSMGQELQEQMRSIEDMHDKINQQNILIQKLRDNETQYKKDLFRQTDELNQLRKKQHTPLQLSSHHMDTIQQTHINQIRVLNEQISSLQQELVRKVEQYEQLSMEYEQVLAEHRQIQDQEEQLQKQVGELQEHLTFLAEDKQKELRFVSQSKDNQLSQMSKMNNDLRLQMSNKMQQLEQQIRDLQLECQRHKAESASQQVQLQDSSTQIRIYQENIDQLQRQHEQELQQHNEMSSSQMDCLKQTYQRQLDQLVEEVEKLQIVLADKNLECDQNKQAVDQLTGYLENAEVNENELLKELENWKNKYEDLEQHCQAEIRRIDDSNQIYVQEIQQAHDQQMRQMDQQITTYKQLMDQRMKEADDHRYQKNDMSKKVTEQNVLHSPENQQMAMQMLQNEVEQLKNKFFEQQRHYEVEEQVREEIKRSQQEQLRRQFEVQMDQLENENRNLQFLLDGKARECEEWKNSYLRGGRNLSTQI